MNVNARAVVEGSVRAVCLQIDAATGTFAAIGEPEASPDREIPGLVLPGFLDFHVHAREYPLPATLQDDAGALAQHARHLAKEDFESAGEAALRGGVCGIAEMPNNPIPTDNAEVYQAKRALAARAAVPVLPIAAITRNSSPFAEVPYKMMMDGCCGGIAFDDLGAAETTLERYRGQFVIFHCEDPELLRARPGERQPLAELRAIERVLEWTTRFGLQSHVAHISTRAGVEAIAAYNRQASSRVSCEVTPHHLCMTREHVCLSEPHLPHSALARGDLLFMNPPLRSEDDRRFLLAGLKSGLVDMLATDHAPHTLEDKAAGSPGLAHLDTLGAFACWMLQSGGFTAARLATVMAEEPGRLFSRFLGRPMGRLAAGYAASMVALELETPSTVEAASLKTRCGWSAFEGWTFPGRVAQTWVDGVCRYQA